MNKKFFQIFLMLILLMYGCNSETSAWEETQQTDTYEAYRAYLQKYPGGEHVEEARTLSEQRYWQSISDDTAATTFTAYLNRYPEGQFRTEAEEKLSELARENLASEGRVTGSGVIIRSDHTTESSSVGVVVREGTIVQILDFYSTESSKEAIMSGDVSIVENGRRINLSSGKAIKILSDRIDSVEVSFSTAQYGTVKTTISKKNIEPMSGQKWYKITTRDKITGWIYGKFIEEL